LPVVSLLAHYRHACGLFDGRGAIRARIHGDRCFQYSGLVGLAQRSSAVDYPARRYWAFTEGQGSLCLEPVTGDIWVSRGREPAVGCPIILLSRGAATLFTSRSYVLNYVHCVFSTKGRAQLIRDREPLWAYFRGIARNCGFDVNAIGGTDNHVHVLLSVPAGMHLVNAVRDLKANSSRFMKTNVPGFAWQDGYAAISVSPSQIEVVKRYIARQEEHHRRRTFDEEFIALLDKAGVRYEREHVLAD
jgi:putative transposase